MLVNLPCFAKSISLNCQEEMRTINRYLADYFGITYFGYIQCFADGTHICLTTDNQWVERFYCDFYTYGVFHKTLDSYHSGTMLWSSAPDQTSFNAFRQHSNIDHGITLIEKHLDNCEFFTFGAERQNSQVLNFYFNHMDILWRHAFYFRDKGADLVKKAQADRFILPRCNKANKETDIPRLDDSLVNQAISTAPIKRYTLTIEKLTVQLSPSEAQCAALVAKGKRLKEIGALMALSPRTVEVHLNNVKHKLLCNTTAEMVTKIQHHSSLHRIF